MTTTEDEFNITQLTRLRAKHSNYTWPYTVSGASSTTLSAFFYVRLHYIFDVVARKNNVITFHKSINRLTHLNILYTVSQKTGPGPFSFQYNLGKYCPILIILSLLQT